MLGEKQIGDSAESESRVILPMSQKIFNIVVVCAIISLVSVNVYSFCKQQTLVDSVKNIEGSNSDYPAVHHPVRFSSPMPEFGTKTMSAIRQKRHSNESQAIHHWREYYMGLDSRVRTLEGARNWQPAAGHFKMYNNCNSNPEGDPVYGKWESGRHVGANPYTIPRLHTSNGLSTPLIPQDGLYYIYGQLTLKGKFNISANEARNVGNKYVQIQIVVIPPAASDGLDVSNDNADRLFSSKLTQYNLGQRLNILSGSRVRFPDDFPLDSIFVSGVAKLNAGDILGMKIFRSLTYISPDSDQSFFGYYQLQKL